MLWRKEKSLVPARNKNHISSGVQPSNKTLHNYDLLALLLDTFNNNKKLLLLLLLLLFNTYLPIISHRSYEIQKHTSESTFTPNTY
jgi:hypothetical protein